MGDATDNIVLEQLRHIRGIVDGMREDRLDRITSRVERIETRLDLAPAG